MHGLVDYRDGFSSTSGVSTQNCIHAVEYVFLDSGLQLRHKHTRFRINPHVPRTRLCLFSSGDHSCHVVLLCRVSSIDGSVCIIVGLSLSDVSFLFHHLQFFIIDIVVVCGVVVHDACHCLHAVNLLLSELLRVVVDPDLFALPWKYHSECAQWLPQLNPS
jgi:hypothetical protein